MSRFASESQKRAIAEALADPVEFAHRGLGHSTWWTQEHLLRAVLHHDRIAVKACHKSSKTFTVAELCLWWLLRHPQGKVVTTSPNFRQVKVNLWGEIRSMWKDLAFGLPEPNQTELKVGPERWAMGMATDRDVDFAGFSGKILVVIDEAPGVGEAIFNALKGVRAGGRVTVIMLGNPIVLGGRYQKAFTSQRSRWHALTINAFDTPNVRPLIGNLHPYQADDEALVEKLYEATEAEKEAALRFPDLARPDWILEIWEDEGPGSLDWEARVMGRFPYTGQSTIVDKIDHVEAFREERQYDADVPVQVGVDVARGGGDETSVVVRQGMHVLEIDGTRKGFPDNVGFVKNKLRKWDRRGSGVGSVKVDSAGDHSIFDQLRTAKEEEDWDFPIHGINVGENPWGSGRKERKKAREKYYNLKAQLWANIRQRARDKRIRGVDDDETIAQLAAVRKEVWHDGSMRVEKKSSLESRGVGSPDRAEALVLAYAEPPDKGSSLKDLKPLKGG